MQPQAPAVPRQLDLSNEKKGPVGCSLGNIGDPIPSMYGIFTYTYLISMVNVGKYTIHGSYGDYTTELCGDFLRLYPTIIRIPFKQPGLDGKQEGF